MRKLIIHFGIHRTGTTALQSMLKMHARDLRKQGVLYPSLGHDHDHGKIAWGLKNNRIKPKELGAAIEAELDDNIHTVVLSSEDFCLISQTHDWLSGLSDRFDVHVLIYLRRQDAWLDSWYNQHIKWPWVKKFSACTPDYFLKHYKDFFWIDYAKTLAALKRVLPRSSIHAEVVDSLGARDTTRDFWIHAGLDTNVLAGAHPENNASLTCAQLDILRRIDIFTLGSSLLAKQRILAALRRLDIKEDDGSKHIFNDDQRRFILQKFAASNASVAQEYFGRDELFGDSVSVGRPPCFVSDKQAYRVYIPRLLKEVALLDKVDKAKKN